MGAFDLLRGARCPADVSTGRDEALAYFDWIFSET